LPAPSTQAASPRRPVSDARLRRANLVAAVAFTIGGSLFALGAAVAQLGSGDATTAACIYFAGGLFFNTGGYASLLLACNAPGERWRWWRYRPNDLGWLSAFVLFAGTLAFAVSLIDAFLRGLTTHQVNRLIWAPEVFGCILFLISGELAFKAATRRFDLAWWIVLVNQVGSILFMISALAAFIRPETGSEINVAVANWGTLTGALCFAIGGVMQAFADPEEAGP
jgi:hypothetical protein